MSSRPRTNTRIELEPEPSNRFDREAIAVFIDNDLVQYISNKGEENQRKKRFLLQLIYEGRITSIKPVYQEAAVVFACGVLKSLTIPLNSEARSAEWNEMFVFSRWDEGCVGVSETRR